jgi:cell wall-associated NlpC family hydrolase
MQIRNAAAALLPATALVFGLFSGLAVIPASAAPATSAAIEVSTVISAPEGDLDQDDTSEELRAAGYGGTITRAAVLARAKNWWDRRVPYSQSAYAWDSNHGKKYRTDCSGFVSMTWKLTSSRTTQTLDNVSTRISWASLKPGDMLLRNGHHVKLFEKWTSSAKTAMWIYEEGSTATDMDHETVSVDYLKDNNFVPWKYNKIRD